MTPNNSISLDEVSSVPVEIRKSGDYFDGYNLLMADPLSGSGANFVVMDMDGKIINSTSARATLSNISPINATHWLLVNSWGNISIWNIKTGDIDFLFRKGVHHDATFNPTTQTIMGIIHYNYRVDSEEYRYQRLVEYDLNGNTLWTMNLSDYYPPSYWNGLEYSSGIPDVTHTNTVFWDTEDDAIYVNMRNLNTFIKVKKSTSQIEWGIGQYGDFTLFDQNGNEKTNLFYHAHAVEKLDENNFILFDNDYYNPAGTSKSRMIELVVDYNKWYANISWVYSPGTEYFSAGWGDADRLPNGNRLGTFGYPSHFSSGYAGRIVEVNDSGHKVWEMDFPYEDGDAIGVYKTERIRLSPYIDPDFSYNVDGSVSLDLYYNFRTRYHMNGHYRLLKDGQLIEQETIGFKPFWQPTILNLNGLETRFGVYNYTLLVYDEANQSSSISFFISNGMTLDEIAPNRYEQGVTERISILTGTTTEELNVSIWVNHQYQKSLLWSGNTISIASETLVLDTNTIEVIMSFPENNTLVLSRVISISMEGPSAPIFTQQPSTKIAIKGEAVNLNWEFFDLSPSNFSLYINDDHIISREWSKTKSEYVLNWLPKNLGENYILLLLTDKLGLKSQSLITITVYDNDKPVIASDLSIRTFTWGGSSLTLQWTVIGASSYTLWKNGTVLKQGQISGYELIYNVDDWYTREWLPATYIITLVVENAEGVSAQITETIEVRLSDPYADEVEEDLSLVSSDIDNILGAPDNKTLTLSEGYISDYVVVDMGKDEEVVNGEGNDFKILATGGTYLVEVGNSSTGNMENLGSFSGTTTIDLAQFAIHQFRYVTLTFISGDPVEIDAIVAYYYNSKEDNEAPRIEQIDDITAVKGSLISFNITASDFTPWSIQIFREEKLEREYNWRGEKIVHKTSSDEVGEFKYRVVAEDIFGHTSEISFRITIEKADGPGLFENDGLFYVLAILLIIIVLIGFNVRKQTP